MNNAKNQNQKYLIFLGLGTLLSLSALQLSATEKDESKERESHYSSSYHEELQDTYKREKLSILDYYKKHPELFPKASDSLPKKLALYLLLDANKLD